MSYTSASQDKDLASIIEKNISVEIYGGLILDWVRESFSPEEVFSEDDLHAWAEENDYSQE